MSIRNHTTLSAIARELNNKYGLELGEKDIFAHNLNVEIGKYRAFLATNDGKPGEKEKFESVQTALSVMNDYWLRARLDELKAMPHKNAILEYLKSQTVQGISVSKKGDDAPCKLYLEPYEVISTICSADLNQIINACCIFADNVAKFVMNDCSSISRRSMHPSYVELRKRKGWDIDKAQMSKTALAKQMTEICNFISCGVAPEMRKSDVTYVAIAILQAKDECDKAGGISGRDEKVIVRFLFRAMYTRYNKLSYEYQSNTRASKGALGVKNNTVMGEPSEKIHAEPEAGPVTVGDNNT